MFEYLYITLAQKHKLQTVFICKKMFGHYRRD